MLCVCLVASLMWASSGKAEKLYKEGRRAEQKGDVVTAYLRYAEASALNPANKIYWLRAEALRTEAALKVKARPAALLSAPAAGQPAPVESAENSEAVPEEIYREATPEVLWEAAQPQPPVELQGSADLRTFDLHLTSKVLWEQVARGYGLDVVFDGDYTEREPIRFRMQNADYRQALNGLELVTGSFIVPLSPKLFLVAEDTAAKRRDVAVHATVVIPIPEPVSTQEAAELVQTVRQIVDAKKLTLDSQRRLVILRDQVPVVRAAQVLFAQLLQHRPQIALEVEFFEVTRSRALSFGLALPTSSLITNFGRLLRNQPHPGSFTRFLAFGGGKTLFGLGVADIAAVATLTEGESENLFRAVLTSVNGQEAMLHVGAKYPIQTVAFIGEVEPGDEVYRPPAAFNFENLGFELKFTPMVHNRNEVSLKVSAEFRLLTGSSFNGIPVISNRQVQSEVRLKANEWAVVSGLASAGEARSVTGLAGLASLPVLGPLFRQTDTTRENRELLILVKPTVLSLPPSETVVQPFRVGSESRPLTPL
jgi:general secretion pathway protein D